MAKKKPAVVTIAERALLARIQRRLKLDGQKLLKCRHQDPATYAQLGTYYIVDEHTIVATHQEPETLGRELGVLKPYEKLED